MFLAVEGYKGFLLTKQDHVTYLLWPFSPTQMQQLNSSYTIPPRPLDVSSNISIERLSIRCIACNVSDFLAAGEFNPLEQMITVRN